MDSWMYHEQLRGWELFDTVYAVDGARLFAPRDLDEHLPASFTPMPLPDGNVFDLADIYVDLFGKKAEITRWLAAPASLEVIYQDRLYGRRPVKSLLRTARNAVGESFFVTPADRGPFLAGLRIQPKVYFSVRLKSEVNAPRVRLYFGMVGTMWRTTL